MTGLTDFDGSGVGLASGFVAVEVVGEIEVLLEVFTAKPLLQISFFPLLVQVNFNFATVLVCPTLVHLVPAMEANVV